MTKMFNRFLIFFLLSFLLIFKFILILAVSAPATGLTLACLWWRG